LALAPIPVSRYLVPEDTPALPSGFSTVDQKITSALPFTIKLEQNLDAVLAAPTGLGATWRDADPAQIVSQSSMETNPFSSDANAIVADAIRSPIRLQIRYKGNALSTLPVVAGYQTVLPAHGDDDRGIRIQLVVLKWDLRAGNMRGPGDFGSQITLAWKHADQASNYFGPAPVHRYVRPRLYLEYLRIVSMNPVKKPVWVESDLGLLKIEKLPRFQTKKVTLR